MLDQLRQIAIFAKTVDHGSFRGAAKALRLSPSVVSHHITQLEDRLGTALLYRSTRKLSVTPDGERLLNAARDMIQAAEAGLQEVSDQAPQPSGLLRVTAPAVLTRSRVIDRVAAFSHDYPNVSLSIDFADVRRELIADGLDVAIRMGWLEDSTLKARKLFDVERKLVASPAYLEEREKPASPEDLSNWDWIELAPVGHRKPEFRNGDKTLVVSIPEPKISVNDANALYRLARGGAGLATLPDFLIETDLENGALVHLLPEWTVEPVGVYAIWPPNAPRGGLVSRFVGFLAEDQGST
ncbi:MAG: LysR family transcriptional regulator [Pseudomonadota bacterium]